MSKKILLLLATTLLLSGCSKYADRYIPIVSTPAYTAGEVEAMCGPQARIASRQAEESYGQYEKTNCSANYLMGTMSCKTKKSKTASNPAAAFSQGWNEGLAGRNAYKESMEACAASHGYSIIRVCVENCKDTEQ